MFLKHNPRSFMTGDDPFVTLVPLNPGSQSAIGAGAGRIDQEVVFEHRHEGLIGIPHGGVAMGLCLDAWLRTRTAPYPVTARFKFGGSGLALGEKAVFSVERNGDDSHLVTAIGKDGDRRPYLRGEISTASAADLASVLPQRPPDNSRGLPYYRNCFVCGHHRAVPGLMRRFKIHFTEESWCVTTPWGAGEDRDRAGLFVSRGEEVHPAVLAAILDETSGWAGFMSTARAGLSVRLELTILRPVSVDEKLLFVGLPSGTRGNPRSPRFFLASGFILAMDAGGAPEVIGHGKGEWVILEHVTDQIKRNLLPEGSGEWIFHGD